MANQPAMAPGRMWPNFGHRRWGVVALALALAVVAGCGGKAARRQAQHDQSFAAGMEQARRQMQQQQAVVLVRGPVRHPVIPWSEDLTLAKVLLQAEITTLSTPRNFIVIRQGRVFQINPRRLLNHGEDLALEAGDVVEVVR